MQQRPKIQDRPLPFKAVLFDMDGLLLDTERLAHDSFVETATRFDVDQATASPKFMELIGHNWIENVRQLSGFFANDAMIAEFRAAWDVTFAALLEQGVPLRPTAAEVIAALSAKGTTMAVVTSSNTARARLKLKRAGLLEAFVTVIGGDVVPAHKPDPAPYLMGAEAVGADPKDCAAFEDSDPGVRSATAAGCTVWQIPDLRPKGQAFPDLAQTMASNLREAVESAGLLSQD